MREIKKLYVVHPGTQHAFRLVNALASISKSRVIFLSWFTLPCEHFLAKFKIFRKRVKPINEYVKTYNFPFFEGCMLTHLKLNGLFNKNTNNPYYYWQILFGCFLLPIFYFNRKNAILITFETCGWPLTKYAKKWGIPVIMNFPSISHERAESLGIVETEFGKKIKSLERQKIDYAISCSNFAKNSYQNLTSAKEHFAIWLGTDFKVKRHQLGIQRHNSLNIACLANTELRKGIDILLKAFNKIEHTDKKLYLIGSLNPAWIKKYCKDNELSLENIILTGPIAQQDLKDFLFKEKIDLHILPSRFDSFGMVVPETMALGIPNIVSPYVGSGEMINNEVDGFITRNLDVQSLCICIEKFISLNSINRNKLVSNTVEKSTIMTWEKYAGNISNVIGNIIHKF